MLTAESLQPDTGHPNRVGGFSLHLVRRAPRNIREIQDTVTVAGRHAMSHDVLPAVQENVLAQILVSRGMRFESMDCDSILLRRHERVGADVGADVEKGASVPEQGLEEVHIVPVVHSLVIDESRYATLTISGDDSRL